MKYCFMHMSTYATHSTRVFWLFNIVSFFLNAFSLNLFSSLLNYSEYILPTPFSTFDSREKEKLS